MIPRGASFRGPDSSSPAPPPYREEVPPARAANTNRAPLGVPPTGRPRGRASRLSSKRQSRIEQPDDTKAPDEASELAQTPRACVEIDEMRLDPTLAKPKRLLCPRSSSPRRRTLPLVLVVIELRSPMPARMSSVQSTKRVYHRPGVVGNPAHAQTMGKVLPSTRALRRSRRAMDTPDGDFVDVHRLMDPKARRDCSFYT